jgi:hypothetical protein
MLIMDVAAVKSAYRASRCMRSSRNGVLYED